MEMTIMEITEITTRKTITEATMTNTTVTTMTTTMTTTTVTTMTTTTVNTMTTTTVTTMTTTTVTTMTITMMMTTMMTKKKKKKMTPIGIKILIMMKKIKVRTSLMAKMLLYSYPLTLPLIPHSIKRHLAVTGPIVKKSHRST